MRSFLIKTMFLMLVSLGFTQTFAMNHELRPGMKMDFNLPANKREEFTNFAFQVIQANCLISTNDEEGNDIFVEVLRKKGKINDRPVSAGDNIVIHVRDKDLFKLVAEPGGKVALTNYGKSPVKAACST